nr:MAG TPA: hypothetical protein [Caudoviricetes sp.]
MNGSIAFVFISPFNFLISLTLIVFQLVFLV